MTTPQLETPRSIRRKRRRERWAAHRKRLAGVMEKTGLSVLGPGLVTGAADDDPSGIATYSQAGAQYGYQLLWSMMLCFPLMWAIQEISARIGRVTGRGLARNMRLNYSPWLVWPLVSLMALANIINLGADLGAMGAVTTMLLGGPSLLYVVLFAAGSLLLQAFTGYDTYLRLLKWLALVMLVYVATALVVHVDWPVALWHSVVPALAWNGQYMALLVAALGTTISPYLFFWQASLESEETKITPGQVPLVKAPEQARAALWRIRLDTAVGMAASQIISFFIIVTTAATLYRAGEHDIQSAQQAAQALAPLAGRAAQWLFALGIIGQGLLAIPVLAGSIAYAAGELLKLPVGMDRKPWQAKGFYGALAIASVLGIAMNLVGLNPIHALIWSAAINGVVAVPVMVMVMFMFGSQKIMGQFARVSPFLRAGGWIATAAMAAAAVGMFATLGS